MRGKRERGVMREGNKWSGIWIGGKQSRRGNIEVKRKAEQGRAGQVGVDEEQTAHCLSISISSLSSSSSHLKLYSHSPEECASLTALSMPCAMTRSASLLAVWRNRALADRTEIDTDCSEPAPTPEGSTAGVDVDTYENTV